MRDRLVFDLVTGAQRMLMAALFRAAFPEPDRQREMLIGILESIETIFMAQVETLRTAPELRDFRADGSFTMAVNAARKVLREYLDSMAGEPVCPSVDDSSPGSLPSVPVGSA